jgi:hypothetical protein
VPKAAVHIHPDTLRVVGVWLSPTRSAYLNTRDGGRAKTVGRETMRDKGRAVTWDEWVTFLSETWPSVARWQAIERNDGEEPRHVLARAVATEAVNRRDAEG